MKVLIFSNTLYPRGGADIAALRQAKALGCAGHEVTLLTTSTPVGLAIKGVRIKVIPTIDWSVNNTLYAKIQRLFGFFYSCRVRREVSNFLKEESVDLAIGHLLKGYLTTAILVALRYHQVPIIRVLHDYELLDPHNLLLDGKGQVTNKTVFGSSFWSVIDRHNRDSVIFSLVSWLEYCLSMKIFPVQHYTALVPVSHFSQRIHKSSRLNLPYVEMIPNFISEDYVKSDLNIELRNDFIFFGRLSKEKGINTLLKAYQLSNLKSKLTIIGDGSQPFAIPSGVNFIGPKYGAELFENLSQHRFMILPSEWYENNPLSVLEAMLLGVPCIVSEIGGLTELVIHGFNGFLFKPGSYTSLQKVLILAESVSNQQYLKMSVNCKNFILENYSEEMYTKSWNNLIEGVCTRRGLE